MSSGSYIKTTNSNNVLGTLLASGKVIIEGVENNKVTITGDNWRYLQLDLILHQQSNMQIYHK